MSEEVKYKQTANRLRELRRSKGILQKDVISKLGCARATYTHYELGYRRPDGEMLKKLADLYDTTTDYILGYADVSIKPLADLKILLESLTDKGELTYKGQQLSSKDFEKVTIILDNFLQNDEKDKPQ